jgi:hypothetical protein
LLVSAIGPIWSSNLIPGFAQIKSGLERRRDNNAQ